MRHYSVTTASNTPPKLLIIGNGMAAGRLIDEIMKRNAARYAITVVGDEPQGSYNRIMLSPVLAGEHTQHSIIQKNAQWYQDNAITFVAGGRVLTFNSADKTVTLSTGEQLSYDQLVIATGSIPSNIPATNQHLNNIFTFRTLNDVNTIKKRAATPSTPLWWVVDYSA
jgi:assimilatory nitrate reductase (NADH) beta subunit (EC 1.7.1.1)